MSITKEEYEEMHKTKIVVHINNYIFSNEDDDSTSNELGGHLRSLATPDSIFLEPDRYFKNRVKSKPPNQAIKSNDCIIVHAKSLKFPVKIRPAYEIYPSVNLIEDKRHPWINKNFNNKFDFQLPFINPSHQTAFQNYQARYNSLNNNLQANSLASKISLPNYLNTQYIKPSSFKPKNIRSIHPILTYKKILKLKESNSNNSADKLDSSRTHHSDRTEFSNSKSYRKNMVTYGQNLVKHQDSNGLKAHENAHSQKNLRFVHRKKEPPLMKPINYSFKLPPFLTSKYATTNRTYQEFSVNLINQEIQSKNEEEIKRLSNMNVEMDKQINQIIKNYPSIVIRRNTLKRF